MDLLPEIRHWASYDWVIAVLTFALVLLASLRVLYPKRFHEFSLLAITDKYFSLPASQYRLMDPFNAILLTFQVLVVAVFWMLYQNKVRPEPIEMDIWYFLQVISLLVLFLMGKFLIEQFIGWLFNIPGLIERFLFEKLSYVGLLCILLFVFCWIILLADGPAWVLFVVGCVLVGAVYLISLFSSFKRNWSLIFRHFFYFILYLCALEIAPFILLYYMAV